MDELKPCKKCGSDAEEFEEKRTDNATVYGIKCDVCGEYVFSILYFGNQPTENGWKMLHAEWNRRAADGTAK